MVIAQGITFHLPSRRRFIPYSWLLYAEMNEAETELYLQYNHCVVTITGTELRVLHKAMEHFHLHAVWECPSSVAFVSRYGNGHLRFATIGK
jgi:hypothetical protein